MLDFYYRVRYDLNHFKRKSSIWVFNTIAKSLPHWVKYFVLINAWVAATSKEYESTDPTKITMNETIVRNFGKGF